MSRVLSLTRCNHVQTLVCVLLSSIENASLFAHGSHLANNIWCSPISLVIIMFYLYLHRNCMRHASISHYQHCWIDYKYLYKKIMNMLSLNLKRWLLIMAIAYIFHMDLEITTLFEIHHFYLCSRRILNLVYMHLFYFQDFISYLQYSLNVWKGGH